MSLDPEQDENLERVKDRIGNATIEFFEDEKRTEFFADELRRFVIAHVGKIAPGSPDRVMRDLRQRGVIDYEVVSRRHSLYRIIRKAQRTLFLL